MHDDPLERRLRSVLRSEAGQLTFTITAAELERRAVLRNLRGFRGGRDGWAGNRRLTLLLAAALGIGGLGAGALIGGMIETSAEPSPAPSSAVVASASPSNEPVTRDLPGLDELIAMPGIGPVLVAQARGPEDAPPEWQAEIAEPPPGATFDLPASPGDLVLRLACRGDTDGVLRLAGHAEGTIPTTRCDGSIHEVRITTASTSVTLDFAAPASWRLVIAAAEGSPSTSGSGEPPFLEIPEGDVALAQLEQYVMEDGVGGPDDLGRAWVSLEGIAPRWSYRYTLWCNGQGDAQYIHADQADDGTFTARTTTQVRCDGTLHTGELRFAEPFGAGIVVAARPGTIISLVITGDAPPIALHAQDGWQLSAGFGPDLSFSSHGAVFSGPGLEEGGPLMVALSCAGNTRVKVVVDTATEVVDGELLNRTTETFEAACTPDGAVTAQTFVVEGAYVTVEFTADPATWTAMTILVPEDPPSD